MQYLPIRTPASNDLVRDKRMPPTFYSNVHNNNNNNNINITNINNSSLLPSSSVVVVANSHDIQIDPGGGDNLSNIKDSGNNNIKYKPLLTNSRTMQNIINNNNNNESDTDSLPASESKLNSLPLLELNARTATNRVRFISALLYALMSIGIMLLTKAILTEFHFHSFIFVAFLQYFTTAIVSLIRRYRRSIYFPLKGAFHILCFDLFPLPILFLLNTLSGLGATQSLNMPLFVLLRRLSILMTLIGEVYFLKYKHHFKTKISVFLMIFGAFIATSFDTTASMQGIIFVLINDICTALNGVLTRRKLDEFNNNNNKRNNNNNNKNNIIMTSEGIMFYTNAFAAFVSFILLLCNIRGEMSALQQFDNWSFQFIFLLLINAISGFGISYFSYLCMKLNSPLTVSMIGVGKNVFTSYAGMMFRDYTFAFSSFVGINISVIGCIIYGHHEITRVKEKEKEKKEKEKQISHNVRLVKNEIV